MELKEFITEAISAIADATSELQDKYTEGEVLINPPAAQSGNDVYQPGSANYTYRRVKDVEFDVALTVTDSSEVGGKAGIKVFSVELGGEGKTGQSAEQVSHIRFSVPITLRASNDEKVNREAREKRDAESKRALG